jgi:hypothetical protein
MKDIGTVMAQPTEEFDARDLLDGAIRNQIGLRRLDQGTADTPLMQGRLDRHQVNFRRPREMTSRKQHPGRPPFHARDR